MKSKVLVLEDDNGVLNLLGNVLGSTGFEVIACTCVAQYRAAKAAHPFDLFLIDVGLPDGNGLTLLKDLRAETTAGIILLTGQSSDEDRETGLALGADDYITKPFRLRDLGDRVAKAHHDALLRRGVGMPALP